MTSHFPLLRLIDANLNRLQEGLRVCEDIARFILDNKKLSAHFKFLRHRITGLREKVFKKSILESRNVKKDVGRKTRPYERERKNISDVFFANLQRAKESARVLEETFKLIDKKISEEFKKIRFRIYELEKKSHAKLETLLHH